MGGDVAHVDAVAARRLDLRATDARRAFALAGERLGDGAVAEALTGEGEGAAGVGSAEVEATRGHRIHMRDVAAHLVETLATPARAGTTAEIWTQTEEEAAEQRLALLGGDPWKLAPPIKRKPKWKQMEEAEGGA